MQTLRDYLESVKDICYKDSVQSFVRGTNMYSGLIYSIKYTYHPQKDTPVRARKKRMYKNKKGEWVMPKRKGSSKQKGTAVHKALENYAKHKKRPKSALAQSVIRYLEEHSKHKIIGAEVPVFVKDLQCCTNADLISEDPQGKLWMWEIKTGFNMKRAKGTFKHIPGNVPNSPKNRWELQRHFTHKGLVDGGLPIHGSHVLNVYEEGDEIKVKKRKVPNWTTKIC